MTENVDDYTGEESDPPAGCPLPLAHDRFSEAHWHLHQMLENYHHPMTFRYSVNAFLHALKSVLDMLRMDLERHGENEWRKARFDHLKADPIFSAFSKGRDIVVHRGSLVNSSSVEMGLFKYDRLKIAIQQDLKTDEPSHSLLHRIQTVNREHGELFVPEHRGWIGEQLGVRRTYREPQLSTEHDVVTASDLALSAVSALLEEAHLLLGYQFDRSEGHTDRTHLVTHYRDYLETTENPALIHEWGWD